MIYKILAFICSYAFLKILCSLLSLYDNWFLLVAENLIGKGGYAEVYKGCLKDGQLIAVKRLTQGTPEERVTGFLHELGIIAHVNHPNTAKLIGYGVQGGLHLVLQLSPLGSLASLLHGSIIILMLLFLTSGTVY